MLALLSFSSKKVFSILAYMPSVFVGSLKF